MFGLANYRNSNFLDSMIAKYSQNNPKTYQFSLCLGEDGGFMTVGGLNMDFHRKTDRPTVMFPY